MRVDPAAPVEQCLLQQFCVHFILFKGKNVGSVKYFASATKKERNSSIKGKSKFTSYPFSLCRGAGLLYGRVGGGV